MRSNGRPRFRQVQLKDGFYIEVCNKGVKKGVKIRSESKKDMEDNASLYARYKEVLILGEYKDGIPFIKKPAA
ncbi:MAG: hypothetical protein Q8941_20980 [Bacteroidota bacterium]|nr:hypothetical protein [Bacteroidota bacterium]